MVEVVWDNNIGYHQVACSISRARFISFYTYEFINEFWRSIEICCKKSREMTNQ